MKDSYTVQAKMQDGTVRLVMTGPLTVVAAALVEFFKYPPFGVATLTLEVAI